MIFTGDRGNSKRSFFRNRLTILLIITILPFITFSAYKAFDIRNQLQKEAQTESLVFAKNIASSIDEYIASTGELLVALAKNKDVRTQNYPAMNAYFKEICAKYPYYINIAFIDLNGDVQAMGGCVPSGSVKKKVNAKGTAHFKRAISTDSVAVGDFMYGLFTGQPVVHVTYPVFNLSSQRVGYVTAVFNLVKIQKRLKESNVPDYMLVAVLDDNGTVIARSADPKKWIGKNLSKTMNFANMLGKSEGTGKTQNPDGSTRVFGFAATHKVPWYVRAGVDSNYIDHQVGKSLSTHFIIFIPLLLIAISGWLWIGRDVNRLYAETEQLSLIDPLTGLWNNRMLNYDFAREIARAKRYGEQLSFFMIDIDHFKNYNDTNGHQLGDTALQEVARLINGSVRENDITYRYGGEELCVILPKTNMADALCIAERIRENIEKTVFEGEEKQPQGTLSISLGSATYPLDATSIDELVRRADTALYKAKSMGRNRVEPYSNPEQTTSTPDLAG